ncbi:hypothetical protein [Thermicanus aegyptius]|nr:hypothetical protein [Thermicanus aegyptius]
MDHPRSTFTGTKPYDGGVSCVSRRMKLVKGLTHETIMEMDEEKEMTG